MFCSYLNCNLDEVSEPGSKTKGDTPQTRPEKPGKEADLLRLIVVFGEDARLTIQSRINRAALSA